jgi:hypothetical protein
MFLTDLGQVRARRVHRLPRHRPDRILLTDVGVVGGQALHQQHGAGGGGAHPLVRRGPAVHPLEVGQAHVDRLLGLRARARALPPHLGDVPLQPGGDLAGGHVVGLLGAIHSAERLEHRLVAADAGRVLAVVAEVALLDLREVVPAELLDGVLRGGGVLRGLELGELVLEPGVELVAASDLLIRPTRPNRLEWASGAVVVAPLRPCGARRSSSCSPWCGCLPRCSSTYFRITPTTRPTTRTCSARITTSGTAGLPDLSETVCGPNRMRRTHRPSHSRSTTTRSSVSGTAPVSVTIRSPGMMAKPGASAFMRKQTVPRLAKSFSRSTVRSMFSRTADTRPVRTVAGDDLVTNAQLAVGEQGVAVLVGHKRISRKFGETRDVGCGSTSRVKSIQRPRRAQPAGAQVFQMGAAEEGSDGTREGRAWGHSPSPRLFNNCN